MDLFNLPMYRALKNKMEWNSERQSLISQNLANVNTPGYAAKDLEALTFRDVLKGSTSRINTSFKANAGHVPLKSSLSTVFDQEKEKNTQTLDNNGVSLEEEMLKLNQTANQDYEMKTLLRKHLELMKIALRTR